MDGQPTCISPTDLYARLGTAQAPIVIDVRSAVPGTGDRLIVSACYRPPADAKHWSQQFLGRPVVVYCRDGHEVCQGVARALKSAGIEVSYLDGGFSGWTRKGLPTRRNIGKTPGKWITRERPKIDRIACPWLIRRFIDASAEFIYVPESDVLRMAKEIGATPYDIKVEGVEFTHEGERCSFDTILRIYDIRDPALDRLADIVRGADTSRHDLAPQCGGLFAISLGLSANFRDDHEMLKHGMIMYDALYVWCRDLQGETHNWPAKLPAQ